MTDLGWFTTQSTGLNQHLQLKLCVMITCCVLRQYHDAFEIYQNVEPHFRGTKYKVYFDETKNIIKAIKELELKSEQELYDNTLKNFKDQAIQDKIKKLEQKSGKTLEGEALKEKIKEIELNLTPKFLKEAKQGALKISQTYITTWGIKKDDSTQLHRNYYHYTNQHPEKSLDLPLPPQRAATLKI